MNLQRGNGHTMRQIETKYIEKEGKQEQKYLFKPQDYFKWHGGS